MDEYTRKAVSKAVNAANEEHIDLTVTAAQIECAVRNLVTSLTEDNDEQSRKEIRQGFRQMSLACTSFAKTLNAYFLTLKSNE